MIQLRNVSQVFRLFVYVLKQVRLNVMDNPKSRGYKHVQNKKKYKNNTKIVAADVKKEIIRKPIVSPLESNWDRYEQREQNSSVLDSSTDFSLLAKAPITTGSHFQFKNDKVEIDKETMQNERIFQLNLNSLSESIACIPFNEQCGISKDLFTEAQLLVINRKALDICKKYEESHKNELINDFLPEFECDEESESSFETETDLTENRELGIDEVDENLQNLESDDKSNLDVKKNESDLEKWLDDILDD